MSRNLYLQLALSLLLTFSAAAQNPNNLEDEVLISIDVGYNTAYRTNSWVPVDVLVINEQDDLTGYVEVRSYDGVGNLINPVYRLPVECPRDSKKRFRMYAYMLSNTARVEGLLFEKGRLAVDAPAHFKVSPIKDDALMVLLLDSDRSNYGFLFTAAQEHRIYMHHIMENQTALLPGQQQAYDAFDAIIIGETNPARFSPEQRILLEQYVRNGGTIIVMTGLNSARLADSWVEGLTGLAFGSNDIVSETALATAMFPEKTVGGVDGDREGLVTALSPTTEGIRRHGSDTALAWRRDLGRGHVYTLPVDAKGRVLQNAPEFHALWSHMLTRKQNRTSLDLNFAAPARSLAQQLPSLSGVTIRPLSTVMTYLLLYLGVGVIANWIFWSRLKRREMAWVTLVFFSFAFTAYAMVSGTSGWAKSAELHNYNVLVFRPHTNQIEHHAYTGILTARTHKYAGTMNAENPLVRDSAHYGLNTDKMGFGMRSGSQQPYAFVSGSEPRLEDLRVGASELRMTHIEERRESTGGVEGTLIRDREGVRGTLANLTGLKLREPHLYLDGAMIPLRGSGDTWKINQTREDLSRLNTATNSNQGNLQYTTMYYQGSPEQMLNAVRTLFFVDDQWMVRTDLPPMVLGYAETSQDGIFLPDEILEQTFAETLVVAEVDIDRQNRSPAVPLSFMVPGREYQWKRPAWANFRTAWNSGQRYFNNQRFDIRFPENYGPSALDRVQLQVLLQVPEGVDATIELKPVFGDAEKWETAHTVDEYDRTIRDEKVREARYTIDDWSLFTTGNMMSFDVSIVAKGDNVVNNQRIRDTAAWLIVPNAIKKVVTREDEIEWQ